MGNIFVQDFVMQEIPRVCVLLKNARESLDMSQNDLANRSGLSRAAIQNIEAGQSPTVQTLEALAPVLKREAWEFLIPANREAPKVLEPYSTFADAVLLLIAFLDKESDQKKRILRALDLVEGGDPRQMIDRFRKSLKISLKPASDT